jgi:hypothetical protein
MKFSEYHNLSDDKKLIALTEEEDEIKKSGETLKDVKQAYVVVPGHESAEWGETLIIADVLKGTVVGRMTARGRLISHPVINGDQCSFAVQQQDGTAIGTTHQLPSGSLITTFRIGGAGSKDVSFDPIFKRKEDFAAAAAEPGSEIQQVIAKVAREISNDVVAQALTDQKSVDAETEAGAEVQVPAEDPGFITPVPVTGLAPARGGTARPSAPYTPTAGVVQHDPSTQITTRKA